MGNLCLGCMQTKENSPVCEHCGFDERKENQSHQLPLGTLLKNQYLVGRVLGQGGFGITYIGWDRNLSIPVAIKEYFPSGVVQRHTHLSSEVMCVSGEAPEVFIKHRDRFLKEARTLAQLSDIPEIVQIKGFFAENSTAYIVMEYVQGITLKEHLKKLGRPMTEEEALTIMEPVLKALQKVHDLSLIHRDISPDNIMLPTNGGIKLIDFGTVRYIDDSGMSKSTETVLKPGFAPMEQYNTRGNLGTWTDVYAICATFHYLLTGKVPPEVMSRFEGGEKLTELRNVPQLSENLITTLEKGMAIQVPKRIQTIQELYDLLYGTPKPAPRKKPAPPKKTTPRKKPASERKTASKGILFAAAIIGALLLTVGIGILSQKSAPPAAAVQTVPETTMPSETIPVTTEPTEIAASGMHEIEIRYNEALALAEEGKSAQSAIAFGKLGNYKDSWEQSSAQWEKVAFRETFAVPSYHTLGVRTDGTVLVTGLNNYGQCDVSQWTDIIAVSASTTHTVGLKSDGTVVATGCNDYGQCDISDWTNIVAIHAGIEYVDGYSPENKGFTIGIRADGTVVSTGINSYGQCDVSGWSNVVYVTSHSIRIGTESGMVDSSHTVGLCADGTVVVAGPNDDDWCAPVDEWRDIVAVSAQGQHIIGLKADGTTVYAATSVELPGFFPKRYDASGWENITQVYTTGNHTFGLCADGTVKITGNNSMYDMSGMSRWTDIVAIAANDYTIGLKSDGTVVGIGYGSGNLSSAIAKWRNVVAVYANAINCFGICADGTVVAAGKDDYGQFDVSDWTGLIIPEQSRK